MKTIISCNLTISSDKVVCYDEHRSKMCLFLLFKPVNCDVTRCQRWCRLSSSICLRFGSGLMILSSVSVLSLLISYFNYCRVQAGFPGFCFRRVTLLGFFSTTGFLYDLYFREHLSLTSPLIISASVQVFQSRKMSDWETFLWNKNNGGCQQTEWVVD